MKVSSLFDLLTDARDLLDFFEEVDSREQLVTRLDRLKRNHTDEFLECIEGLRSSITETLGDTLEMSAVLDDPEPESDPELDQLLEKIASSETLPEAEKQNPPETQEAEKPKDDVLPEI
jgi:hypothetical protein